MTSGTFLNIPDHVWLIIGFIGQFIFGSRFFVQWIYSEFKKESHIPVIFWYLSILGGIILLLYAISINSKVFIVGQSFGVIVYARNLRLIHKKKQRELKLQAST